MQKHPCQKIRKGFHAYERSDEENRRERPCWCVQQLNTQEISSNLFLFVWGFSYFSSYFMSFPRRYLLKQSFGRLFSHKPLEKVEWRWQEPNDDFKMTDIIPYYYCLVDCQRTNVLQTSNVINSEPQIWITNLQYMCGFSRIKKWSGAEKYPFA